MWRREVREECGLLVDPAEINNFGIFNYEIKVMFHIGLASGVICKI